MTDNPTDDATRDQQAPGEMTRDEWIAYHVARAPKITAKQWAATLTLLRHADQTEAT
ncbi:hypothetical protein ABZ897_54095 [Nonomuraea sp. NPDC046802]|uniref:hypothetical protein n=1 Tax=Nonomuraea sp. NPDC046802 TaxID=3154919 RepID=UPI0033DBAFDE